MTWFLYFCVKFTKTRSIFCFHKNRNKISKVSLWLLNRIQRERVKVTIKLVMFVMILIVAGGSLIQSAFVNLSCLWLGLLLCSFLFKLCSILKLLRYRTVRRGRLIKLLKHLKVYWRSKMNFNSGKEYQLIIKSHRIILKSFNLSWVSKLL